MLDKGLRGACTPASAQRVGASSVSEPPVCNAMLRRRSELRCSSLGVLGWTSVRVFPALFVLTRSMKPLNRRKVHKRTLVCTKASILCRDLEYSFHFPKAKKLVSLKKSSLNVDRLAYVCHLPLFHHFYVAHVLKFFLLITNMYVFRNLLKAMRVNYIHCHSEGLKRPDG